MPPRSWGNLTWPFPRKKTETTLRSFLASAEMDALTAAPDISTWCGRRDHTLLIVELRTGLHLLELTGCAAGTVAPGGRRIPRAGRWFSVGAPGGGLSRDPMPDRTQLRNQRLPRIHRRRRPRRDADQKAARSRAVDPGNQVHPALRHRYGPRDRILPRN